MPEAGIIPLNYDILSNKLARSNLQELEWYGIVDLEPFNTNIAEFYVDHHLSVIGREINAKKIRFDVNGDSGAWQLFLSQFIGIVPEHIAELAVMTRTTDTAGYTTQPPTTILNDLTDLDFKDLTGKVTLEENEQRIWLLDDTWGTVKTVVDHLKLINSLAKDGFVGLRDYLPQVNKLREHRKLSYALADTIDLRGDFVLYSFTEKSVDKVGINRRLQHKGVKIVASMARTPLGVKISLRRNRGLSETENQRIQLNELASIMGGGGHAGASGCFTTTVEEAVEKISKWCTEKGFSLVFSKLN